MQYGYFDDDTREYVITRPNTPYPWINYLGCEEFFSLFSNTSGGYCFCRDARMLRLTRYRYNNVPADVIFTCAITAQQTTAIAIVMPETPICGLLHGCR